MCLAHAGVDRGRRRLHLPRRSGRDFELGQSTCLATPKGARIATCGMVLNNTSWQFTDTPCMVSETRRDAEPARAAAHDHHTHHHRHGG